MNECISQELNNCTQTCINLYGNYTCACAQKGYSLHKDGVTCQGMSSIGVAQWHSGTVNCEQKLSRHFIICLNVEKLVTYNL